jgi:hypothetical protein
MTSGGPEPAWVYAIWIPPTSTCLMNESFAEPMAGSRMRVGALRDLRPTRSTIVSRGDVQHRLGEGRWVEDEREMPLPPKAVELSFRQQFGNLLRRSEH